MKYFVEIVDREDGPSGVVVKRMGPFPEQKAELVMRGAERNLNHERYFVRMTPAGGD